VPDVPFLFEHSELRAHRRVARVAGKVLHHLGGGRAAAPIEDVDDLPLAAAQDGMERFDHDVIFVARAR